MKNLRFLAILTVVCSLLLLGTCSNPAGGSGEMGMITINVGGGTARSAGFNNKVGPGTALDLTHEIWLIPQDGGTPITRQVAAGVTQVSNWSVPANSYDIEVHAFVNGWPYAREDDTAIPPPEVTVTAGQTATAQIKMKRIPNAIALDIADDYNHDFGTVFIGDTASHVITVYNFTDTDPVNITAVISGPGFSFTPTPSLLTTTLSIGRDGDEEITIYTDTSVVDDYTATLNISYSSGAIATIHLESSIIAPTTTIIVGSVGPAQFLFLGDPFTRTVVVTVSSGETPNYQWFSNIENSTTTGSPTNLGNTGGANTATLTIPTDVAGTMYYYLVVSAAGAPDATSSVLAVHVRRPIQATGLNFNVIVPVADAMPDNTVTPPSGTGFTATAEWRDGTTPVVSPFVAGTTYNVQIRLQAEPDYAFPSDFTATINSNVATPAIITSPPTAFLTRSGYTP
ncbi:MAG: hypothetical protein FWH19_04250 [Treponema sp.]|nr:hypothetical protein [Treponema sp.]